MIALPTSASQLRTSMVLLSTISSDGKIHIYDLYSLPSVATDSSPMPKEQVVGIEPLAAYDSKGTRLTCLTLADDFTSSEGTTEEEQGGKRKRADGSEEDGESGENEEEEWEDNEEEEEEGEGEE
jgi:protein MAK11